MGSRGAFLESGGFRPPYGWHAVGVIQGIKILERKDQNASVGLPPLSNTPGTAYTAYRKDGSFYQLRVFKEDRTPSFDIDYGVHNHVKSLHIHYYIDGKRSKEPILLHKGDALYEKYKSLFKGVKL